MVAPPEPFNSLSLTSNKTDDKSDESSIKSEIVQRLSEDSHRKKEENLNYTDINCESKIIEANLLKEKGNEYYRLCLFQEAKEWYTKAIEASPVSCDNVAVFYCNRAACCLKLNELDSVVEDCTRALEINPNYEKALLRRASSYERMEKFKDALADYEKVLESFPTNITALIEKGKLEAKIKEQEEKMKGEMIDKLKDLGNHFLSNFGLSLDNFKTEKRSDGSYNIKFQQS
ncbi:tetratricopeptide repeat protein 1-like [Zophobas morio]|uniref:tetratricopeptide repeat protein 1-like n=1 Tax=Zophobas morio TaxID=2755281 RepID=UPI003083689E